MGFWCNRHMTFIQDATCGYCDGIAEELAHKTPTRPIEAAFDWDNATLEQCLGGAKVGDFVRAVTGPRFGDLHAGKQIVGVVCEGISGNLILESDDKFLASVFIHYASAAWIRVLEVLR